MATIFLPIVKKQKEICRLTHKNERLMVAQRPNLIRKLLTEFNSHRSRPEVNMSVNFFSKRTRTHKERRSLFFVDDNES